MLYSITLGESRDVSFSFYTTLSGTKFVLMFDYNYRAASWYFGIADANGDIIKTGIKVKSNIPLLNTYNDDRLPLGELTIVDVAKTGRDPIFDDLDNTHVLMYEE